MSEISWLRKRGVHASGARNDITMIVDTCTNKLKTQALYHILVLYKWARRTNFIHLDSRDNIAKYIADNIDHSMHNLDCGCKQSKHDYFVVKYSTKCHTYTHVRSCAISFMGYDTSVPITLKIKLYENVN